MDTEKKISLPELWAHQKEAIKRAQINRGFGLFFDMGTGKTRTAIEIIKRDELIHGKQTVLIVCPLIVCSNWKREFARYAGLTEEEQEEIIILEGSIPKRIHKLEDKRYSVYITNYDAFVNDPFCANIKARGFTSVVLDESHRIKSPTAKRTKHVLDLICANRQIKRVLLLSGTPILASIEDLFTQIMCIDDGIRLGSNFYSFKARYMCDLNAARRHRMSRYFPDWAPRPGALEEITRQIEDITMSVAKKDCLDLPPLTKQVIEVELTLEQKRVYQSIKKDLLAEFGSGAVTVTPLAITKTLRLMQWCHGFMPASITEPGEAPEEVVEVPKENPRIEALKQLLEDYTPGNKVIVWASWRANITEIMDLCEKLGIKAVRVDGTVTGENRERAIQAFREVSDVRVFVGHPGAGGIGITLIEAAVMIYYSRSFNLEHDMQSEARNYRGGSEMHEKITRVDIVTKNTIDAFVVEQLALKQSVGDSLLEAIKYE